MSGDLQEVGGWRACGGALMGPSGPTSLERGLALFGTYAREAERLHREDRRPAARVCAHLALDVAAALVAADDWRCAAGDIPRRNSPLRWLREFTCQVKLLMYG